MHKMIGKQVRDKITGVVGTVTAVVEYDNGLVQYQIVGVDQADRPYENWVPANRVEEVSPDGEAGA